MNSYSRHLLQSTPFPHDQLLQIIHCFTHYGLIAPRISSSTAINLHGERTHCMQKKIMHASLRFNWWSILPEARGWGTDHAYSLHIQGWGDHIIDGNENLALKGL